MPNMRLAYNIFVEEVCPECPEEISEASYYSGALAAVQLICSGVSPEVLLLEINRYGMDCPTVIIN